LTPTTGQQPAGPVLPRRYLRACRLAERGRPEQARRLYAALGATASDPHLKALLANDLAVLAAVDGDLDAARAGVRAALAADGHCEPARLDQWEFTASGGETTPPCCSASLYGTARR
jgi:hypothetical protein